VPRALGPTRLRVGIRVAALCAACSLAAACGQVLGLDDIGYDVIDGGTILENDAHAPPDAPSIAIDGSGIDGTVSDSSPHGGDDQSSGDANAPPTGPLTIAQGPDGTAALGLAIDDARVYWVTAGANGSVLSVLKDGGDMTTIATGQPYPLDIAVSGTSVFWSVTPAGTGAQCMAMVASTPGAAPDGGDAGPSCVVSSTDIAVRMTLGGGGLVILAQGPSGSTNEYVGTVSAGADFTNVETQGPASAVTATAHEAYFGNKNGNHVDEVALPSLVYGPTVCTAGCGNTTIVDLTTDVALQNVLWISQGGGAYSAPIAVSAASGTQYLQVAATPQRMARDASHIYVTVLATSAQAPSSIIAASLAPGGDAGAFLTLSSPETNPFGIAVDETAVYWDDANGRVRKTNVPLP
jgi:hypothetical protein